MIYNAVNMTDFLFLHYNLMPNVHAMQIFYDLLLSACSINFS